MIRNCDYGHIKRLFFTIYNCYLNRNSNLALVPNIMTGGLSVPRIKINTYLRMLCKIKEALSPSMKKKLRLKQFMAIKDD